MLNTPGKVSFKKKGAMFAQSATSGVVPLGNGRSVSARVAPLKMKLAPLLYPGLVARDFCTSPRITMMSSVGQYTSFVQRLAHLSLISRIALERLDGEVAITVLVGVLDEVVPLGDVEAVIVA